MRRHVKAPPPEPTEGRGQNRSARLACLFGLSILLTGLFGMATAMAAPTAGSSYVYTHSFGNEGQINGGLGSKSGIAVEPGTGNVAVAEPGNISVFARDSAPADGPLTSFNPGDLLRAVAIDQTSGAIYVQGYNTLTRWTSDGAPVPTYTLDPSYAPVVGDHNGGIAVDPTTGDLLVAEETGRQVGRFDPSGTRLSSFPVHTDGSIPFGVAVDSTGKIYVTDEYGVSPSIVRRYTAAGEPLGTLPVVGGARALGPDPLSGGIVVVTARDGGALWIEGFDAAGERVSEVAMPELPEGSESIGVAVDGENGQLYAFVGGFFAPAGICVFEAVTSPGTEPPTASALTPSTVHLETEADPGPGAPAGSFAYFEYSNNGGKNWEKTPPQELTEARLVEADLTGLLPNEKYLVRTVVGNEVSRHVTNPSSFITVAVPPIAATGAATDISETSAVINGTINPAGLQTTYHFEYGSTTAYGGLAPAGIEAVAGNGRAPRIFSRTLGGLQPETTYHYRLVATNSAGASESEDRTFTTTTAGGAPARAYEQVTPVDKLGSTVDPYGFQAAPDGSALAYQVRSPVAESSPQFGRFIGYRGANDWDGGLPTDPPINTARNAVFTLTLGISDDFAHAFVVSNRDLLGGGVENGANFYRKDLRTGQYTPVVSTDFPGAFNDVVAIGGQNEFVWGNSDYSEVMFTMAAPLLPGAGLNKLYRWSMAEGLQLESILPDGGIPSGGVSGHASEDGRRVYFTVSGGNENGVFLREEGQTRAISVSHRAGDAATPQEGDFLAASRDGRYGFFFTSSASAQLTSDAPEVEGNIYRYDAVTDELEYLGAKASPGQGAPSATAALGVSDDGGTFYFGGRDGVEVWREGAVHLVAGAGVLNGEAVVSPSGRYLGFQTGPNAGGAVFLYDAASEDLTCASCLSDGSDPGGANIPKGPPITSNQFPSTIDDQGQLFFDTPARLVAADVNGSRDVYVFEDDQPRLITPGNAPFDAVLGDISADGSDVYFTTTQKLVGRDNDQAVDIYDARVGGGLPDQSPPPRQECLRDDCKESPNAGPELPFGGSEALSGPGNVNPLVRKRCGKGTNARKASGKSRCVKQAKKKKHTKKAKSNRRQAR